MAQKTSLEQVAEFHKAFNQQDPSSPDLSGTSMEDKQTLRDINKMMHAMSQQLLELAKKSKGKALIRMHLLMEELAELGDALADENKVGALDALGDIQYVTDGAFLAFGLAEAKDAAIAEIHRANLSKLDENGQPVLNEAGRVLKSDQYAPPNLQGVYDEIFGVDKAA